MVLDLGIVSIVDLVINCDFFTINACHCCLNQKIMNYIVVGVMVYCFVYFLMNKYENN
jgi:hypothetical protein